MLTKLAGSKSVAKNYISEIPWEYEILFIVVSKRPMDVIKCEHYTALRRKIMTQSGRVQSFCTKKTIGAKHTEMSHLSTK